MKFVWVEYAVCNCKHPSAVAVQSSSPLSYSNLSDMCYLIAVLFARSGKLSS